MSALVTHFINQLPGGSGIATRRLHRALRRAGVDSQICFGAGQAADATMVEAFQNRTFFWRNAAALATSWRNRQMAPGGFVTSPRWIRKTPIQALGPVPPKIAHFHWVARWLDLPSFFSSLPPGMPVAWTVRDLIPITGGCNYPGDCDGFTKGCGNCPQEKRPSPNDATRKYYRLKEQLYSDINLHFVGNSEWTTSQIRRSGLAKYAKSIRTIHNGLDPSEYRPIDKSVARKALGVPEDRFVIGFSCSDLYEKRKGVGALMEAVKGFPRDKIVLVVIGAGKWPSSDFETITLGSFESPRIQSIFYSALDVFAMPSQMETFGNTVIESMSCETPVAAYTAGGVIDIIKDGVGLIDKDVGSVSALFGMLDWFWKHPNEGRAMGIAARQRVIDHFSVSLMAQRHMDMYRELLPGGESLRPAQAARSAVTA